MIIEVKSTHSIFDKMVILLTPSEFDRLGPLDHLIGKRVSILNTDLPDRPFIIKVLEEATESRALEDLKRGEYDENAIRKDFTISEMVAIKRYYEPKIKSDAKKRMTAGKHQPSGKLPQGRTRDITAMFVGVSGRTLEKAEDIVKAAEADPENFGDILNDVDSGKTSISHAHTKINRRKKHQNPPPLPDAIFDVILADLPWKYFYPLQGALESHYSVITKEEIEALKIPTSEDAILFLWATNPKLPEAFNVIKAWGFDYKTNLVWVKDKIGTGYYVRGQYELLLISNKGKIPPPIEENRFSSVLNAPRKGVD